jgi:apolipoprotein N-acyltransferase
MQAARPLILDGSYFVVALSKPDEYLAAHLQDDQASTAIEEALRSVTGRILAFRLVQGETVADWQVQKDREAFVAPAPPPPPGPPVAHATLKAAAPAPPLPAPPTAPAPAASTAPPSAHPQSAAPEREVSRTWEKLNERLSHGYKNAPFIKYPHGQAQYVLTAVKMISDTMDVMMPPPLILLVNVALSELIPAKRDREEGRGDPAPTPLVLWAFPRLTAALVGATLLYGVWAIRAERLRPTFVAAALQGDVNQNVNQDPVYVDRVLRTFTEQGREAAAHGARLAVWPETAFPGYLQTGTGPGAQVAAEAVRNNQTLLVGGVEYDAGERKSANSLFLLNARGNATGSYQKRQLVPFGEFTPGRKWMPFLEALHVTTFDMKRGADVQPLLDGGPVVGKLGTVICFESSYPRLTQEQVRRGAGLLVVSTDDAWFGRTAAARQHSAIAAVRAAETDRYLVRSAATGVSQVIDPTGRVLTEAGLFRQAVVWAPVQSRTTVTPYVRWGDWFIGFCAGLLAVVSLLPSKRRARQESDGRGAN